MQFSVPTRRVLPALLTGALASTAAAQSSEAEYLVVFEATWSAQTHPIDFPGGAHFSGMIGGSHDATVSFWEPGSLASPGIEAMAETGSTRPLDAEVQSAIDAGHALEIVRGPGPNSPGEARTRFQVSQQFPEITLVSMVAPSPDWFVGVSGLSLFRDGDWVDQMTVELLPWDSGTDSGVTYVSANQDTQPPEAISLITTDPVGNGVPLGRFVFLRCDGAGWSNYGTGFPGTLGVPTLCSSADPTLGSSLMLQVGNSRGVDTRAILFLGLDAAQVPGSWGGDFLLVPSATIPLRLPVAGQDLPLNVPNDELLCGLGAYFQVLQFDPGAADGISSSAGLELRVGE